ncbi:NUDIX domain-containing protein [Streptomyces sp. NPDC059982]|uniref:NUDIX hydrolase n=2 Tax=unclassified Streptomyces TaxID=2593676 RepID=UPI0036A22ADA
MPDRPSPPVPPPPGAPPAGRPAPRAATPGRPASGVPATGPAGTASAARAARPRGVADEGCAGEAARPAPLVAVSAVVLDTLGRVLVRTTSPQDRPELPGGAVRDTETPEDALARALGEELGRPAVPVGRLLAVDSCPPGAPGVPGRSIVVHVHLVGPLAPDRAAAAARPRTGGGAGAAEWLTPDEAVRRLPDRVAPRLRAAVAALRTGSLAHLIDGVPQPGSPAGLDPAVRVALENAGGYDEAAHRAARPKALTAANVLFTDRAGGVLLVRPGYGEPGRWLLPGGGVDSDLGETPRAAAAREVREEIGLDLEPGRLLAVNWSHRPGFPARIRFLYDGGVLGPDVLARIRLRPVELLDWRTAQRGDLRGLVKPKLRRQIKAALRALAAGTGPLELHEGRPVGHPGSPGPS